MTTLSSTALTGVNAAQTQLNVSAHNIANVNTPRFKRQEVTLIAQTQGGVQTSVESADMTGSALASDVVTQLQAKHAFLANLAVFKTHDRVAGALLDQSA